MEKKNYYNPPDKNGRPRVRRSFVVYPDTANKFSQIAKITGVTASELLQSVMSNTVQAYEQQHGEIVFAPTVAPIDLTTVIEKAKSAPHLKRGNPHPTGRKPKNRTTVAGK